MEKLSSSEFIKLYKNTVQKKFQDLHIYENIELLVKDNLHLKNIDFSDNVNIVGEKSCQVHCENISGQNLFVKLEKGSSLKIAKSRIEVDVKLEVKKCDLELHVNHIRTLFIQQSDISSFKSQGLLADRLYLIDVSFSSCEDLSLNAEKIQFEGKFGHSEKNKVLTLKSMSSIELHFRDCKILNVQVRTLELLWSFGEFSAINSEFVNVTFNSWFLNGTLFCHNSNVEDLKVDNLVITKKRNLFGYIQSPELGLEVSWLKQYNSPSKFQLMAERNNLPYHSKLFESYAQDFFLASIINYTNEKKGRKKQTFTILPLLIAKWSNDFGRSWLRPLVILIITTHFLYFLSCRLYYVDLNIIEIENTSLKRLPSEYYNGKSWIYLLPTHKISDVFPNLENKSYIFLIYFLDLLQRVISGFLIFQLIRAFRFNYGK